MVAILALVEFGLLIGFSFYAVRTLKGAFADVNKANEKYLKEYELANRLGAELIKFSDEGVRLKQTIKYLENENAELYKKVIGADPGAAISDILRRDKPGFKGP